MSGQVAASRKQALERWGVIATTFTFTTATISATTTFTTTSRLSVLNQQLVSRTFLVGERLTLADLAMAVTLLPAFQ